VPPRPAWSLGGVSIGTGSACTLRNNFITGNQSDAGAGIRSWGGWAMITDNVIANNTAGGAGGGIYYGIDGGWDTIARNVFSGNVCSNDGGGLYGSSASWGTIVRQNVFIRNRAGRDGGGIYVHSYYSQVYGNVFFDNTAVGNGGGAFLTCNRGQQGPLERCTFVLNSAAGGGGVCIEYGTGIMLRSSIFWMNRSATGPEIRLGTGPVSPSQATVQHSVVRGGPLSIHVETNSTLNWGAGMLTSDPRFVDAAGGDLHLTAGSPCIDAGDAAVISPPMDFEGDPRTERIAPLGSGEPRCLPAPRPASGHGCARHPRGDFEPSSADVDPDAGFDRPPVDEPGHRPREMRPWPCRWSRAGRAKNRIREFGSCAVSPSLDCTGAVSPIIQRDEEPVFRERGEHDGGRAG
jgi:hypothetical protein